VVVGSATRSRPTGVTIIAVLNIIGGIFGVIGGLGLIAVGAILPGLPSSVLEEMEQSAGAGLGMQGLAPELIGGFILAMGAVVLAIGIASFIVAYGLWKGLGWAWMVTVVLSIISIVLNAVSIATGNFPGIVSIIISGVILYYMFRPHVKEYFGRGPRVTS
jgi:hypothetical protein